MLHGIDVSKHQGNINWDEVKKSGMVDFAIIRAGFRGYGNSDGNKIPRKDGYEERNMQEAKRVNIPRGIYFFSQAITEQEGIDEAKLCIELANKYGVEYPIYFDAEFSSAPTDSNGNRTGRADNLSKDERTKIAIAFCEEVKKAGYIPGVYSGKYFFYNNLDFDKIKEYEIWLAHYTKNGTKSDFKYDYNIWQYSSKGKINGISGNTDVNHLINAITQQNQEKPSEPIVGDNNSEFSNGDLVSIKKDAVWYNGNNIPSWVKSQKWYISSISGDRAIINKNESGTNSIQSPINIKFLQKNGQSIKPVEPENNGSLNIGDKVRISKEATQYGRNKKFSGFVYNTPLFVRQINGDRIVISTVKTGPVTGAVHKKYIIK